MTEGSCHKGFPPNASMVADCASLHYTKLHYITPHYNTLPPTKQLQIHYTNYTTPQLQLHGITTTLHPAVVGEGTTATIAATQKRTRLQPPFSPSMDSLRHP